MRFTRSLLFVVALLLLAVSAARAQLTIEIIGGAGTTTPIAIVPFENEGNWPLGITGVVGADLTRSGLFKLVDYAGILPRPVRAEDVRIGDWRARGFSCDLFVDPPGREWNGFVHRTDELVTVLDGRLELLIGGDRFVAAPGDELLIPKGVIHSVRNLSAGATRWLYGYG